MSVETPIVIAGVAVGCLMFYLIWRYAQSFAKHMAVLIVGILAFTILLVPSLIVVIPFFGKDTEEVPVLIESISKYRGDRGFHPGKYGRVVEVGFDTVILSADIDGRHVTDAWAVPAGLGSLEKGQTREGLFVRDGEDVQLAVKSAIRFPFTAIQLIISIVPGSILFMAFAHWYHERKNKRPVITV